MRLYAALALALICASSAWAQTGPTTTGKFTGASLFTKTVKCQTPINQLACRVDPNGYVQGVWYGAWGANSAMTAAGPQPYIQGDSNFWYTQNWCDKWGLESKCVNGNPSPPAGAGPTTKGADVVYNLANGFSVTPAGVPTQTITYVTAMAVCYKNGKIGKVTWTTLPFTANWEASTSTPLNPPMSVVTPSTAAPSTVSCGTISDCDHTEVFTAPTGKVLGGFTHKCKYTQGWGRFAVNGAQHPTQRLDHIEKACAVTPTPYPNGKFTVSPACTAAGITNPNDPLCSDSTTYQC